MGILSGKSSPTPPALPPAPAKPKELPAEARKAKKDQKKASRAAFGSRATVLTSPLGITDEARTVGKTALGS